MVKQLGQCSTASRRSGQLAAGQLAAAPLTAAAMHVATSRPEVLSSDNVPTVAAPKSSIS